jgi:hypothetical protein
MHYRKGDSGRVPTSESHWECCAGGLKHAAKRYDGESQAGESAKSQMTSHREAKLQKHRERWGQQEHEKGERRRRGR